MWLATFFTRQRTRAHFSMAVAPRAQNDLGGLWGGKSKPRVLEFRPPAPAKTGLHPKHLHFQSNGMCKRLRLQSAWKCSDVLLQRVKFVASIQQSIRFISHVRSVSRLVERRGHDQSNLSLLSQTRCRWPLHSAAPRKKRVRYEHEFEENYPYRLHGGTCWRDAVHVWLQDGATPTAP